MRTRLLALFTLLLRAVVAAGALGGSAGVCAAEAGGRVVDAHGRPVANARVRVDKASGRTDKDGRFRLDVPTEQQQRHILDISHPDFADATHVLPALPKGQIWPLVR